MEIICIDTNLLIDYYRKKDKTQTRLRLLAHNFKLQSLLLSHMSSFVARKTLNQTFLSSIDYLLKLRPLAFDLTCARKSCCRNMARTKSYWQKYRTRRSLYRNHRSGLGIPAGDK